MINYSNLYNRERRMQLPFSIVNCLVEQKVSTELNVGTLITLIPS